MKRPFKIAAIAIGLVSFPAVAVFAAIVAVMLGRQAVASGFEFNGIRIVKDSIVSVAVIPLGDGKVALIDAGNDKSGKAILAELSRRQLTREAVSAILQRFLHVRPEHRPHDAVQIYRGKLAAVGRWQSHLERQQHPPPAWHYRPFLCCQHPELRLSV
jgi:hypothetical protein